MKLNIKVIQDSKYINRRLTTLEVNHPAIFSSELRKHRDLSVSTRKINIKDAIRQVQNDPYIPSRFNDSTDELENLKNNWRMCAGYSLVGRMIELGAMDDEVIPILTPYINVTSIITATTFQNFCCKRSDLSDFGIMCGKIALAVGRSQPVTTEDHLPFYSKNWHGFSEAEIQFCCAASCYNPDLEPKDLLRVAKDLIRDHHLSYFEHVAKVIKISNMDSMSNFHGWRQLRKTLPSDRISDK